MSSVLIGVFTVILIYMLTKKMYGERAGLISALLLCFLPWHIIQSRVGAATIETPLLGCLIFLSLVKSINKKSNSWFLLSCLFLSVGSFYTYQASLLFVPIFLVTLVFLRKELYWLRPGVFLLGILIFLVILSPLIFLQITGQIDQYLGKVYRLYYQDEPFKDTLAVFLLSH